MSIYLVRQTASGVDPVISLREKHDPETKPPHAQLYYNSALHSYKQYIGYPGPNGGIIDYIYGPGVFSGSLVGTPAKNRLYGVTVELYEAGSVQPDGSVQEKTELFTRDIVSGAVPRRTDLTLAARLGWWPERLAAAGLAGALVAAALVRRRG